MAEIIDPELLFPKGTKNVLMSSGLWDLTELEWDEKVDYLELRAIATIRASVNYNALKEDLELLKELITLYIQYQFMTPLFHVAGMRENAEIALSQYNDLIEKIRTSQIASGIQSEETFKYIPGLIIG